MRAGARYSLAACVLLPVTVAEAPAEEVSIGYRGLTL